MERPDTDIKCFTSHMGLYAMEPLHMQQALSFVMSDTLRVMSAAEVDSRSASYLKYSVIDGVAIVPIVGSITKRPSKYGGTSSLNARRIIRDAVNNDKVDSIMLYIDSPGGQTSGIADLAAEIRTASLQKNVSAYIEDMGASAGYWIASQANAIFMNKSGEVGSIGTFMFLYDSSEKFSKEGIKPILIASGDFKGIGAYGTEITDTHKEYLQKLVNDTNAMFLEDVSSVRNISMEDLKKIANGKVYGSQEAIKYGLVDGISSYDEVFASLVPKKRDNRLSMSAQAQRELDIM